VQQLRTDHAICMIDDGRINVAGIREDRMDPLVEGLIAASL